MTYARARLWLGISNVGFFVVLSVLALWLDLPHRFLAGRTAPFVLAVALASYILISFPFDVFGGYLLPVWHQRTSLSLPVFLVAWLRGVLSQGLLMGFCGYAILLAGSYAGTAASIA
ncbi:MAG: hypothetical protein H7039_09265, partial [Bryobacteraceae bacterium]|nr:hypothetical protein [Bryobacteraceae bacterium]